MPRLGTSAAALAAAAAALLAISLTAEAGRNRRGALVGKSKLVRTAEARARGTVSVKTWPETSRRAERTLLCVKLKRLERDGDYSLWIDDPATTSQTPVCLTFEPTCADRRGRLVFAFDTQAGDPLPFLATVEELEGCAVQVRAADGRIVAVGEVPAAD